MRIASTYVTLALFSILPFLYFNNTGAADSLETALRAQEIISTQLPDDIARLEGIAADSDSAADLESLGHALIFNRHIKPAAWLYASSVLADPTRATALNALGVALAEGATGTPDEAVLTDVIGLQRAALMLAAEEPTVNNNLGTALLRLGQISENPTLIHDSLPYLLAAAQGAPAVPLYMIRLAEALRAAGELDAARKFMTAAFALNPVHPSLVRLRRTDTSNFGTLSPDEDLCLVDFGCASQCPRSIIGQVDRVTCEMSQASSVSACRAGEPFPRGYDCSEQFPQFGILIPGLNSGFSLVTPWGGLDVLVQGDGQIDYRIKLLTPAVGPAQAFVGAQGSYEPLNGTLEAQLDGGIQFALLNRSPAMRAANEFDLGPSAVWRYAEDTGNSEIRLEGGRGVFLAH